MDKCHLLSVENISLKNDVLECYHFILENIAKCAYNECDKSSLQVIPLNIDGYNLLKTLWNINLTLHKLPFPLVPPTGDDTEYKINRDQIKTVVIQLAMNGYYLQGSFENVMNHNK